MIKPRTIISYLRELAGADPNLSNRKALQKIAGNNGLPCLATLYRLIEGNDLGEHARTVLDLLDVTREVCGGLPTTIDDYRALTAGKEVVP